MNGAQRKKKQTPMSLKCSWRAWGWSHIIRSRLPFGGTLPVGHSVSKLHRGKVIVRGVFLAYSSSLASAVAWLMCTCEHKDEKAASHTLGDELWYKPTVGKKKLHHGLALSAEWGSTRCWTASKPSAGARFNGSLKAYHDGFCATE